MGVHEIEGFDYRNMMNVLADYFCWQGKGKTTILGGVFVHGKQNVRRTDCNKSKKGGQKKAKKNRRNS